MAGRSNGAFLPLLPAAPLPASGWTVEVIAHTDLWNYARGRPVVPLAKISRFTSLTWSPAISETGRGSITLRWDDPLFSYPLSDGRIPECLYTYSNLWVIYEDGQWRGEFFGEKVDLNRHDPSEAAGRTVTIGGPGGAGALAWACVLGPYYPNATPKNKNGVYQFKNLPVMASWLQLLWAAQNRGTIPYVHCRFSATKDTGGAIWEDTPPPKPKNTATTTVGDVNFVTDSWALNAAGTAAVKTIAGKLAKVTSPRVSIVGHADNRGTTAYNYQLGLNRANTVRNAILAIHTLAQVDASSKGETQPIASNRTAAGQAKNRRVVVTYQTQPLYVDSIFTPQAGTTLLDLLDQLTSGQTTAETRGPIHCEWIMRKGFELQVRSMIGTDRSKQVVFHEGSTYLQSDAVTYDRSSVGNLIAVQNEFYNYKGAADADSIARWGQREKYTSITGGLSEKVFANIVGTQRLAYREQAATITIAVQAGPQRTPFRDFAVGDWIGLTRLKAKTSNAEKQRVTAISVTVNADGRASYELTINTTRQARVTWLQTQINALINRQPGIRAFIQDDMPGGRPGDLWTPPQFTANV